MNDAYDDAIRKAKAASVAIDELVGELRDTKKQLAKGSMRSSFGLEMTGGTGFVSDAMRDACDLANWTGQWVRLELNGVRLEVKPGDELYDVQERYNAAPTRREP